MVDLLYGIYSWGFALGAVIFIICDINLLWIAFSILQISNIISLVSVGRYYRIKNSINQKESMRH